MGYDAGDVCNRWPLAWCFNLRCAPRRDIDASEVSVAPECRLCAATVAWQVSIWCEAPIAK